jgi:hypothetical protein
LVAIEDATEAGLDPGILQGAAEPGDLADPLPDDPGAVADHIPGGLDLRVRDEAGPQQPVLVQLGDPLAVPQVFSELTPIPRKSKRFSRSRLVSAFQRRSRPGSEKQRRGEGERAVSHRVSPLGRVPAWADTFNSRHHPAPLHQQRGRPECIKALTCLNTPEFG